MSPGDTTRSVGILSFLTAATPSAPRHRAGEDIINRPTTRKDVSTPAPPGAPAIDPRTDHHAPGTAQGCDSPPDRGPGSSPPGAATAPLPGRPVGPRRHSPTRQPEQQHVTYTRLLPTRRDTQTYRPVEHLQPEQRLPPSLQRPSHSSPQEGHRTAPGVVPRKVVERADLFGSGCSAW
ncbi:hypothetical protein GCM10009837_68780 [Streptomyces durmitorensis]